MTTIAGFTGTQDGATLDQVAWLRRQLILSGATELHHGDCIGADAQAHAVARELGLRIVIHPPDVAAKRAFCDGDLVLPPRPYLVRNHDIVNAAQVLFASPSGPEKVRSGTWATVRYARRTGTPVHICLPEER